MAKSDLAFDKKGIFIDLNLCAGLPTYWSYERFGFDQIIGGGLSYGAQHKGRVCQQSDLPTQVRMV